MLKGTLDDFALTDVFRLLASSHRTGRLDLERPAGSGHILFLNGKVVDAETSLSTSLLGQKLVASGALTEKQLRTALDERAESGTRLGQIVVGAGLVQESDLKTALTEQIEDAVVEVLQWDTGEFSWEPAASVEPEGNASFEVDELLSEASRRFEEMELLQQHVPSSEAVPVMAPRPPDGAEAITMSPQEWQTLVLVDGSRSVAAIAAAVGRTEMDTMRTLFSLVSGGLVEIKVTDPQSAEPPAGAGAETGPEPAAGAEAEPEILDAEEARAIEITVPPRGDVSAETQVPAADAGSPEVDLEPVAVGDETVKDEWFADPVDAVDPMSTGQPSDFDLDGVEVSVDELPASGGEGDPAEERSVAFPSADMPKVDRAAAARELAGLSADESRRARPPEAEGEEDEEGGKGLFSRLMGKQ